MPIGTGLAKGLSYKHDWNTDVELLIRNGERVKQAQADAEAKMNFYREKFKSPDISTEYDRQMQEQKTLEVMKEVQSFEEKNPNWRMTLQGQMEFERLTKQVVNNDITNRNMRVRQAYEQFRKDAVDRKLSTKEIDRYESMFENYDKYGNVNGPSESGEIIEFSYNAPTVVDMNALFKTYADLGRKSSIRKEGNKSWVQKDLSEADALTQASVMYSENTEDVDREYQKMIENNPALKEKYPDTLMWVKDNILARAQMDISNLIIDGGGRKKGSRGDSEEGENTITPYYTDVWAPYVSGRNTGKVYTAFPFIQTNGSGNIVVDDIAYVNINGKSVPFNSKGLRINFKPLTTNDAYTYTEKTGSGASKTTTQKVDPMSNYEKGNYTWKKHSTGDGEDLYVYYDVKISREDYARFVSGSIEDENAQKILSMWGKAREQGLEKTDDITITIGTKMDVNKNTASSYVYNQSIQKLKSVDNQNPNKHQGFNLQ